MENLFLSADKFEGRLNMGIFTNVEKSITEEQLATRYPETKFLTFEKSNIDEFIRKTYESVGGEIVKGGFNDTEEVNGFLSKASADLGSLKPIKVSHEGNIRTVYVLQKAVEDTLKKGNENELEKGVMEAFEYSGNIVFKKTGGDIKSRLINVKDAIEDKCEELCSQIMVAMEALPNLPTQSPNTYGYRELVKCPYKVFDWSQTYCDNGSPSIDSASGEALSACASPADAKLNSNYNNLVYQWLENAAEVKAIEMYENNLDDKSTYELTAKQMIALKF